MTMWCIDSIAGCQPLEMNSSRIGKENLTHKCISLNNMGNYSTVECAELYCLDTSS